MSAMVGCKAPGIELEGVLHGEFGKHSLPHADGTWTLLLFYPLDFTFVCPTEVIAFSDSLERFRKLGVAVYGISVDSKFTHLAWTETARERGGVGDIAFALLSDLGKEASRAYGVLTDEGVALRGLFLIDEEGVIQHATVNNLAVGRSVEEALRLVKAFQHVKKAGEVCPADWHPGDDTMRPDPSGLKEYASGHS